MREEDEEDRSKSENLKRWPKAHRRFFELERRAKKELGKS